jgi:hypothetical protein
VRAKARTLGLDSDYCYTRFHQWLETSNKELPFRPDEEGIIWDIQIWERAHQYQDWRDFAYLVLMILTCGTSEADVERATSVHRDISGNKSTRLGSETVRDRLQLRMSV